MILHGYGRVVNDEGQWTGFNCDVEDDYGNRAMVYTEECREHHSMREISKAAFRAMTKHLRDKQQEKAREVIKEEVRKEVEVDPEIAKKQKDFEEEHRELIQRENAKVTQEKQELDEAVKVAKEIMAEKEIKPELSRPQWKDTASSMKKYLDSKDVSYGIQDSKSDLWKIIKKLSTGG